MKIFNLISISSLIYILCSPCFGHIALRGKQFNSQPLKTEKRVQLELKSPVKNAKESMITGSTIAAIIPMNMRTTNQGNQVRDQILQKTANSLLNSPMIKNSRLFKAAKKMEKKTKLGMKIKSSQPAQPGKKAVEHKIDMDVQAGRGQARLRYKGYVKSHIEYRMENGRVAFSVEEDLSANSKIALSHQKDNFESRQWISYQLNW